MFRSINKNTLIIFFFIVSLFSATALLIIPQQKTQALYYNSSSCTFNWSDSNRINLDCGDNGVTNGPFQRAFISVSGGLDSGDVFQWNDATCGTTARLVVGNDINQGTFTYSPEDEFTTGCGEYGFGTLSSFGGTISILSTENASNSSGTGQDTQDQGNVADLFPDSEAGQEAAANADAGALDDEGVEGCTSFVGPFGWVMCWVLDAFDGIYNFFKGRIQNILLIDEAVFDTSEDGGRKLYSSWASVRNLANALIAISALIIIVSQIFGFEILSAYTVKKSLPRILIAAIGIQLSWIIFTSMILLINAIGVGLHDLLIWPFVQAGGSNDITSLFSRSSDGTAEGLGLALFTGATVGAIAGAAALSGAWLSLVLTLLGAIISILIAFFVILVRSIIIIILLVLAPVAIAAWVIPGTQSWWNIWWQTFSKLLLMLPLIMALFAAGTIGANIISNISGSDSNDAINVIGTIVVYFAPLFLITATYKFAGNVFGKIAGIGSKVKGESDKFGFFGLRDQAKADKEYVAARKKEDAYKTLADPSSNKFRRGLARRRTETMSFGAIPKSYAAKKFDTRKELATQKGIEEYDKDLVELSQREFKNAFESVSYDKRKEFIQTLHNTALGDNFTVDGKEFKASAYMKLGSAETTAGFKQTQFFDKSLQQISAQDDPDVNRLLRRVMSAPVFDERMTDLTRGADIYEGATRDTSGRVVSAVGVRNSTTMQTDEPVFNKMFQGYEKLDDDRKTVLRDHIFNLNHAVGEFDIAASKLSRAAGNQELGEADLKKFTDSMQGKVDLSDMLKVQQSRGALQIQYDSGQDKYIAVPSASVGISPQNPPQNPPSGQNPPPSP